MTFIAPEITREHEPYVADERTMLEGWLSFHRQTLLMKCAGLTAEQLKQRAVEPSSLSLLGLVRHMAEVERAWFRRRVAGEDVPLIYCSDDNEDGDFDDVDDADAEADFALFGRKSSGLGPQPRAIFWMRPFSTPVRGRASVCAGSSCT